MAKPSKGPRALKGGRRSTIHPWLFGGILGAVGLAGIVGAMLFGPPESPARQQTIGGSFTLTEKDGREVTDRDFRGKYLLVYFGYTSCPDVCPTTLNEVSSAMTKLGVQAARVQPLFVTVDPKRDTPAVVGQYASSFPPVIGLTGTTEQIAQVARAYRVTYAPQKAASGSADYTVDHSSVLYLMGPDGRFVAPIPADADGTKIAADVSRHLS